MYVEGRSERWLRVPHIQAAAELAAAEIPALANKVSQKKITWEAGTRIIHFEGRHEAQQQRSILRAYN
jgi:hypothetical protein